MWSPRKKTVALEPAPRPSRIRRDPPPPGGATAALGKKIDWSSSEWETRLVVAGVVAFAVAISIITVGFSAITGKNSGAEPADRPAFAACAASGGPNCVIDGDSIRLAGARVEIAGLRAPEVESARCPAEQRRGVEAAERLIVLLNSGPVTIGSADGEGRRQVAVSGADVAASMIAAGAARAPEGSSDWCS
ncbi:MAG TPA: hypothetical protein VM308_08020 [Sphingomicrobium sp.]|nr:hypothetical protein [Sphingomicrobium sp.]